MWVRVGAWWVVGGCVVLPLAPDGLGEACGDETPCPEDLLCVVDEWEGDVNPSCQVPCEDAGDCVFRDAPLNTCHSRPHGYCANIPYE